MLMQKLKLTRTEVEKLPFAASGQKVYRFNDPHGLLLVIRSISRVVLIGNADAFEEILDKDIAGAAWVAETAARSATATPQVAKLRIPLNELYAMPEATQSLIADSRF